MAQIGNVTAIYELLKKAGNVEAQELIMELREQLVAKSDEVLKLKEDNAKLQKEISLGRELRYEAPYYWRESGDKREGPFCQLCYDKDGRLIRLQTTYKSGLWHCDCCDHGFRDGRYVDDQVRGVTWGR